MSSEETSMTTLEASTVPVPGTVREPEIQPLLKIIVNHCPSAFTRSRPGFLWIYLGRWEKEGNLILALMGLAFGLNSRNISNYPTDNYSLHISPQAQ